MSQDCRAMSCNSAQPNAQVGGARVAYRHDELRPVRVVRVVRSMLREFSNVHWIFGSARRCRGVGGHRRHRDLGAFLSVGPAGRDLRFPDRRPCGFVRERNADRRSGTVLRDRWQRHGVRVDLWRRGPASRQGCRRSGERRHRWYGQCRGQRDPALPWDDPGPLLPHRSDRAEQLLLAANPVYGSRAQERRPPERSARAGWPGGSDRT